MTITFIAAVARNGVVGRDGQMPWRIPGEQKGFKAATMGHPMVMGRRTFDSHGLLPGRRHIVLTRDPDWSADGVEVAHSVDEALFLAGDDDLFVTGGAQIWEAFAGLADRMLLSEIPLEPEGDTTFPGWPFTDSPVWREASRESHDGWVVVTYERHRPRTQVEIGPRVARSGSRIKVGASCAIRDGDRLLLTRREDNGLWCLPGGGVDAGETWSEAAVREVREETGLHVEIDGVLAAYSNPDVVVVYADGNRNAIFGVCFRAHVARGAAGLSDEVTEVAWLTEADVTRLPIVPAHRSLVRAAFQPPVTPTIFD
ncbi:dihydrofolate reductase [Rudaeicoccus suwonensis]|uniref:Dihydrofolate reductase n=1 Tax=Rudaeicoccus suwonensis TaxID=657409 RepID=A0A561ECR1_9MICO|nr:dihydrofolate reductase [Rudaeicoccus suwonensis]TWE13367.1 dihydrofolate reductase [Rudaeicoccus suwonensis]